MKLNRRLHWSKDLGIWIQYSFKPKFHVVDLRSSSNNWASLVAQLVKNPPAGDLGSIPRLGRSPGEGNSYPLQYSGLENSTDYTVHRVAKSQTWLSDFNLTSLLQTIINLNL